MLYMLHCACSLSNVDVASSVVHIVNAMFPLVLTKTIKILKINNTLIKQNVLILILSV